MLRTSWSTAAVSSARIRGTLTASLRTCLVAILVVTVSLIGLIAIPRPRADAASAPYAVSTLNSIEAAAGVAVAPDGKTAYVIDGQPVAGGEYALFEVDTSTDTISRTITDPSFFDPVAVAVAPSGDFVYVLNRTGTVSVVATSTATVKTTIGTANSSSDPQDLVISPDGTTGYVSEKGFGVVSVLNLTKDSVTRTVTIANPEGLALSPNGRDLYVASYSSGPKVAVVDTITYAVSSPISSGLNGTLSGLAVSPSGSTLYVVEHEVDEVAVVDLATSDVVATVTGFSDNPGAVVVSPNGSTLYVTDGPAVTVVDTSTDAITHSLDVGPVGPAISTAATAVAMSPSGATVYIAGLTDALGTVFVLDTATETIVGAVPTVGYYPVAVAVSPDGKNVYVANEGENVGGTEGAGVTVIDGATATVKAFFGMGPAPRGVAVSPNGKTLYVTDNATALQVVSTATDKVTSTVTVGHGPLGVAVSPDGTTIYVANFFDSTLSVVDATTNSVINTINVGTDPTGVAVSPSSQKVYVVTQSGVSVVDTATDAVTGTITSARSYYERADDIAISPNGQLVYVADAPGVHVINTATDAVTHTIGTVSDSVALSPDGKTLYSIGYANGVSDVAVVDTSTDNTTTTITDSAFEQLVALAVNPDGNATYALDAGNSSVHVITQAPRGPAITSPASARFTVGRRSSFTITTSGYPTPAVFESGGLPKGVAFRSNGNGTATISGTPAPGTGGIHTITIDASNRVGAMAVQTFKLTVDQPPRVTSGSKVVFVYNIAKTFKITTRGYPIVANISENGLLPPGVTFKNNKNGTATISGKPTVKANKSYRISIGASNGVSPAATFTLTLILEE
jgi:YVTN family beta-propeller protein